MSNDIEKTRLIDYATLYKESIADPSKDPVITNLLPNNADRALTGVNTKTMKFGEKKMSAAGQSNVSKPKKPNGTTA